MNARFPFELAMVAAYGRQTDTVTTAPSTALKRTSLAPWRDN